MLDIAIVDEVVRPVLQRVLARPESYQLSFSFDVDHDGDDVIIARIEYGEDAPKIDAVSMLDAVIEAMRLLSERGDRRFLHVRPIGISGEAAEDEFARTRAPRRKSAGRG